MRISRMIREGAPCFAAQRVEPGPWEWIDGPLSARPATGERVPADAVMTGIPAIDPRLLIGTANTPRAVNGAPDPLTVFLKSPHTIVSENTPLVARTSAGLFAEAEIAVVIGRTMASISAADAPGHVLGYTLVNDVTDQDEIPEDPRMFRAKNGSAFTPAGRWIETDFDPANTTISIAVDGQTVATATVADLHVPIAEQLAYISEWTVLRPGDVVMTGCPGTGAMVRPGQTVEVAATGLGSVRSTVHHADPSQRIGALS